MVTKILILVALVVAISADQAPPLDERCRDDENVLDCIMRMNQVNANEDTYSSKIKVELYEGDIVWTQKLKHQIGEMRARDGAGLKAYDAIKNGAWPKAVVPYTFARGFTYGSIVKQAIADYNAKTCVKFVPMNSANQRTAGGYVEFMHGGGCYSMIGRQGGRQQISLGRGCGYKGTAIHEMMHALGWFHEQSRRDRDTYITIYWNNINKAMWYNFQKYRSGQASTLGESYDKQSVMHYGNYAFSINRRKTIVSKSNPAERFGGQFRGLSPIDIRQLNKYYKCGGGPKPTEGPKEKCENLYTFCHLLNGYCSNNWVKTNCKKTCDQCPKTKVCKDSSGSCADWARRGYCKGKFVKYMRLNCKKSCPQYC